MCKGLHKWKPAISTGANFEQNHLTQQENRVSSGQLYGILQHKVIVRGIWQSMEGIGHGVLGKLWATGHRYIKVKETEWPRCMSTSSAPCPSKTLCNTPTDLGTTESVCWLSYENVKTHTVKILLNIQSLLINTQGLGNRMRGRATITYIQTACHLCRGKNHIL